MTNKAQICDFLYEVYSDSSVLCLSVLCDTISQKSLLRSTSDFNMACVSYGSASPEMIMLRLR